MAYYNPNSGIGGSQEVSVDQALLGTNLKMGCFDSGQSVGLNDLIYQEAGKLGIPVANPYAAFKQHGQAYMSQTDSLHIHPNEQGMPLSHRSSATRAGRVANHGPASGRRSR